ncbi:hypothetical protein BC628DRAFT_531528 [Trametes gibbosa]|nr:hypothetical protein BC628DRAFT_531528 [Trametes gibbosa]
MSTVSCVYCSTVCGQPPCHHPVPSYVIIGDQNLSTGDGEPFTPIAMEAAVLLCTRFDFDIMLADSTLRGLTISHLEGATLYTDAAFGDGGALCALPVVAPLKSLLSSSPQELPQFQIEQDIITAIPSSEYDSQLYAPYRTNVRPGSGVNISVGPDQINLHRLACDAQMQQYQQSHPYHDMSTSPHSAHYYGTGASEASMSSIHAIATPVHVGLMELMVEHAQYMILPQVPYRTRLRGITDLPPPINFLGFSLRDAYARKTLGLSDHNETAFGGRDAPHSQKMSIVFSFVGCHKYSHQVNVWRGGTLNKAPLTRGQLATVVAKEMQRFLGDKPLFVDGRVLSGLQDLVLINVHRVSKSSLQPTIGIILRV